MVWFWGYCCRFKLDQVELCTFQAERTLTDRQLYRKGRGAGDRTVELALSRCVGSLCRPPSAAGMQETPAYRSAQCLGLQPVTNKTGTLGDVVEKCQDIGSEAGLLGSGKLPTQETSWPTWKQRELLGNKMASALPAAKVSSNPSAPG